MPFIYVCDQCGHTVKKHTKRKLPHSFCNLKCYGEWRKTHGPRKCIGCGHEFDPQKPPEGKRAANKQRQFCSWECYSDNRKKTVTKICKTCQKPFTVRASYANRYSSCSLACKKSKIRYSDCHRCGRRFRGEQRRYKSSFCSEVCRRPPIFTKCLTCEKNFRVGPAEKARRFCSMACYRRYVGESGLEATVRRALDQLEIPYCQEFPAGRWSIDFALDNKIALEVDGDYWHSLGRNSDKRKDAYLAANGWTVIRLSENEIHRQTDLAGYVSANLPRVQ